MSTLIPELEDKQEVVCSVLARKVRAYFQDREHRTAFEAWYKQKYGKDYEWRKQP